MQLHTSRCGCCNFYYTYNVHVHVGRPSKEAATSDCYNENALLVSGSDCTESEMYMYVLAGLHQYVRQMKTVLIAYSLSNMAYN